MKRIGYYIALLISLSLVIGIFSSNGFTSGVLAKFTNEKGLLYSQNWVVLPLIGLALLIWFRKSSFTFQLFILLSFFITPALIVRGSVQKSYQLIACSPEVIDDQSGFKEFQKVFPSLIPVCEGSEQQSRVDESVLILLPLFYILYLAFNYSLAAKRKTVTRASIESLKVAIRNELAQLGSEVPEFVIGANEVSSFRELILNSSSSYLPTSIHCLYKFENLTELPVTISIAHTFKELIADAFQFSIRIDLEGADFNQRFLVRGDDASLPGHIAQNKVIQQIFLLMFQFGVGEIAIYNDGIRVRNSSKIASEQGLIEMFKKVTPLVGQLTSLIGSR